MIPRRLTPPDGGPGTTDHTLVHDGHRRAFHLQVPPVVPLAAPLVIQLHGGGGNGGGLDRLTRFNALADRERFAVAAPNGLDRHWDDGRHPARAGADDVGFIAALIDAVAGWVPVDRRRVYVAGISNGAMMAARLANEIPDRIAAVGQVAGTAAEDAPAWWRPGRPVPFIGVHGTADPILPYEGGRARSRRRDGGDGGRVLGVDEWAALVAADNGASGPLVTRARPDVAVRTWDGPSPQSTVEFWRVEGGGHTWPGGPQYLPVGIIGPTSSTFDATAELWRFFSARRLDVQKDKPSAAGQGAT